MPEFNAEERQGKRVYFAKADGAEIYAGEMGFFDDKGKAVCLADVMSAFATAQSVSTENDTNTDSKDETKVNLADLVKTFGRVERVDDDGVLMKRGVFCYQNSAEDALDRKDIGKDCFVVDSTTVAKTGTVKAGSVFDVDDAGVWVEFR